MPPLVRVKRAQGPLGTDWMLVRPNAPRLTLTFSSGAAPSPTCPMIFMPNLGSDTCCSCSVPRTGCSVQMFSAELYYSSVRIFGFYEGNTSLAPPGMCVHVFMRVHLRTCIHTCSCACVFACIMRVVMQARQPTCVHICVCICACLRTLVFL